MKPAGSETEFDVDPHALALHYRARVVDAHADTLLQVVRGRRHLGELSSEGHVDLPRLLAGGVDLQVFAVWVDPSHQGGEALVQVVRALAAFRRELVAEPRLQLVRSRSDLERVGQTPGRVCALLALEGAEALCGGTGAELDVLETLYVLGVRAAGLTWNGRNALADGVEEGDSGGGLTRAGRAVVRAMNRLGMIVDIAHLAPAGVRDVLELSAGPVIASHANCRALCDHPRNLTDAQILALAARGGVLGISFVPEFLRDSPPGAVHLEDVVAHIDHAVQLAGPEHVGLGSDFDGTAQTPVELPDVRFLPRLTEALLRRGYPEPAVEAILGGNFLRVFQQIL